MKRGQRVRPRLGQSLSQCLMGLMLFAGGVPSRAAVALQATPTESSTAASCEVVPRSTTEILAFAEAQSGETASIQALPIGDPADPATTAAITVVLREMAACLISGDMLRFYALHSDA
jgi:hypothetical protein